MFACCYSKPKKLNTNIKKVSFNDNVKVIYFSDPIKKPNANIKNLLSSDIETEFNTEAVILINDQNINFTLRHYFCFCLY